MAYAAMSAGAATLPERIIHAVSQPFVNFSITISNWMEDTIDKFVNADFYKREYELYKQKVSELILANMDKERIEEENRSLREMLKIPQDHKDFTLSAPCSVIARTPNDVFGGFIINKGTNDGIELYDPVFTSIGLVGMVVETAPTYSRVRTLLSTELNISVTTGYHNVVGIIENDILYAKEGQALMSYISKDSTINVGDVVVTAGSEFFPPGLIIGTVSEVFPDSNGLSLHAKITPAENVFQVTSVFVITDFEGQGISLG